MVVTIKQLKVLLMIEIFLAVLAKETWRRKFITRRGLLSYRRAAEI